MGGRATAQPTCATPGALWTLAPLLLWMAAIAAISGEIGSEQSMRHALSWLFSCTGAEQAGAGLSDYVVWPLRKGLHLFEYGVLAALALRWVESFPSVVPGLAWRGALLMAAGYAALDEVHQLFVPARTGSPWDIGVDVAGAALGLSLLRLRRVEGRHFASRLLDIAGASFGLVLSAPLLLLSAAAVWVAMGRPVLFRQLRLGRHEQPFWMTKLRTMNDERDPDGALLPGRHRLTRVGRWLRALSLDEIPQLWNVLKGEMSLVGPRPLYPRYLPYYTARERTRHLVRPGLTGLAQVFGRNSLTWDERLELDAQYVERKSLALDLRLLLLTVGKVLARRDVRDEPIEGSLADHRRHES
jgi:lipopolysaccharide/colanic/teichoic acid biosynthesis glycosyltransferase